jgi:GNAT superfamily N-acetyltransferase
MTVSAGNQKEVVFIPAQEKDLAVAMDIINSAKKLLRDSGVDQWQNGYPDETSILQDIHSGKGFFIEKNGEKLGYLCVDYDGEPAYEHLKGEWGTPEPYVVVHRMAFAPAARGKGLTEAVFHIVEEMSRARGVHAFRVDTDDDNLRMKHILDKNGFTYRGTIWFDNSVKIAYDKNI